MKPTLLLMAALAVGTTGCFSGGRRPFPRDCYPDSCNPSNCAPPRVECEGPEKVVVQAPKTTVCVEQHTPCPPPIGAPSPPQPPVGAPSPPQPPIGAPGPIGASMMPIGAPMMPVGMPMMPIGAGGMSFVGANVRERTGLGFTIDYIRIPIPCIKPIAVQRPAEVTFQMQQQQQQMVGLPMGYATQPVVAGFGQQMGLVPQAQIGYQQVQVPVGQVPIGQIQQQQQQQPPPIGAAPKTSQELLEECMKKLEESQRKLKELESKGAEKKEPEKK